MCEVRSRGATHTGLGAKGHLGARVIRGSRCVCVCVSWWAPRTSCRVGASVGALTPTTATPVPRPPPLHSTGCPCNYRRAHTGPGAEQHANLPSTHGERNSAGAKSSPKVSSSECACWILSVRVRVSAAASMRSSPSSAVNMVPPVPPPPQRPPGWCRTPAHPPPAHPVSIGLAWRRVLPGLQPGCRRGMASRATLTKHRHVRLGCTVSFVPSLPLTHALTSSADEQPNLQISHCLWILVLIFRLECEFGPPPPPPPLPIHTHLPHTFHR